MQLLRLRKRQPRLSKNGEGNGGWWRALSAAASAKVVEFASGPIGGWIVLIIPHNSRYAKEGADAGAEHRLEAERRV